MIVYQAEKQEFIADVRRGNIDDVILDNFKSRIGRSVAKSEQRSWGNSLQHMANVLDDGTIPDDLAVAVEFVLQPTMKRIDVTLAGHGADGTLQAVIVELKQWETARATTRDGIVMTRVGGSDGPEVHPSYQAWSYAAFMRGFNEAVYDEKRGIGLQPCAFLHNYRRDGVIDSPHYEKYLKEAPLFAKGEGSKLQEFIRRHVPKGGGKAVLIELENGRIRPSKALAEAVMGIVEGHQEFVLLDDQKEVFEACLEAAREASPGAPRVVIVEGGPGTGKSVVAVHLVGALLAHHNFAMYVSKNAAPRRVFVDRLGSTMGERGMLSGLFSGTDKFMAAVSNEYGTIVVDEAHRLTEKGGFMGNLGDHTVKNIVNAARCAVFFIDEDQRVTWRDVGSKEVIRQYAKERGATVEQYALASQFRCGGSDGYLAWIDDVLDIRPTANQTLSGIPFDFQVFDDPGLLHAAIEAKNSNNKARVVAGYCWPWKGKKQPEVKDIVIGAYERCWNLTVDGSLWIVSPETVNEVGCIHTCQGLEVEYIGVIVGPDLIVRNGIVTTVPAARATKFDKSLNGFKRDLKLDREGALEKADRIIKNTYRTLMTRGMKGCYLYCTDAETREYFQLAIGGRPLIDN
ncbi:MAG: DUF2075 domain-containing protein [Pseudomonadota bacterium]